MPRSGKRRSSSGSRGGRTQMKKYKVRRGGANYTSSKAKRRSGQRYYPGPEQAKENRSASGKAAARQRKKRGTQWRHARKSKAEVQAGH